MDIIDLKSGLNLERVRVANEIADEEDFSSLIINSSVDGILAFDKHSRYTIWNPAMEKISGMKKSQVLGKFPFDLFPFLRGMEIEKAHYDVLRGVSSHCAPTPYHIPETGAQGYFQQYSTPIFNERGEVIGGIAIIRDVTDLKKIMDDLIAENQALLKRLKSLTTPS